MIECECFSSGIRVVSCIRAVRWNRLNRVFVSYFFVFWLSFRPTTAALASVQLPSLAPTQQLSSPSSEQLQLSEVPVCSLENAAVQSSVNSVFSHLTGELNPPFSLPSSLFTSSALPVNVHVSEKLKSKIWANKYITLDRCLLIHCLRISITSPFKILKGG